MTIKQKIIYIYFLVLPLIDLVTSLFTKFTDLPISIGMIIKGLTLVAGIIYLFFFSKSKYKLKSCIYLIIIVVFAILYFILKPDIWSFTCIKTEIINALKYLYFPIMLVCLIPIFEEFKIDNEMIKKIIVINSLTYTFLILVPYFTNTGFNSYYNSYSFGGTKGWFFAANELGVIMFILLLSLYYIMDKNKKWKILLSIPIIYSISLIGTKVSFIGMIGVTFLVIAAYVFKHKKYLLPTFIVVVLTICSLFSPTVQNLINSYEYKQDSYIENNNSNINNDSINSDNEVNNSDDKDNNITNNESNDNKVENDKNNNVVEDKKEIEYLKLDEIISNEKINIFIKLIFNGRENYFLTNYTIFKDSGLDNIMFGLSWNNRENINYIHKQKLIEIDILDILIHYGLIGLILYFLPLLYLIYKFIINIKKTNIDVWLYVMTLLLVFAASVFAGHILAAPAVSIYIVLLILFIKNEMENINNEK